MKSVGDDIIKGLEQALAHAKGENNKVIVRQIEADKINIKAIRKSLKLTQEQLAFMMGVSTSGLQKWEQGLRQPRGAARTLLKVMEQEPEAVLRAVHAG